jgi:hypothetical protein
MKKKTSPIPLPTMKFSALAISICLFYSCNFLHKEPIQRQNSDFANQDLCFSTAYDFPELKIPENFYFDSISIFDSVSRAEYDSYFIQSSLPNMKEFNQVVTKAVKDRIKFEQLYVDPYDEDSFTYPVFTYIMAPIEFYSDDDKISITHVIDTYTQGGNHDNYSWFTLNYDLKNNKLIHFKDVFDLPASKDSADFVEFAVRHKIAFCMDWTMPFDSVDFSFTGNGIYINPELSWACSQNRSLLPADSLYKYVKTMWIKNK